MEILLKLKPHYLKFTIVFVLLFNMTNLYALAPKNTNKSFFTIAGQSDFLKIKLKVSSGEFEIFFSKKVIDKINKLTIIAKKNPKYELGALGVGIVNKTFNSIYVDDVIIPETFKFEDKDLEKADNQYLEILAKHSDVLGWNNGTHYTKKYKNRVSQKGKIVFEIHSHIPTAKTLPGTNGKFPSRADLSANRNDEICACGIIWTEGLTFYHASQHDYEIMKTTNIFNFNNNNNPFILKEKQQNLTFPFSSLTNSIIKLITKITNLSS